MQLPDDRGRPQSKAGGGGDQAGRERREAGEAQCDIHARSERGCGDVELGAHQDRRFADQHIADDPADTGSHHPHQRGGDRRNAVAERFGGAERGVGGEAERIEPVGDPLAIRRPHRVTIASLAGREPPLIQTVGACDIDLFVSIPVAVEDDFVLTGPRRMPSGGSVRGLIRMGEAADGSYDLILLDAFSSDAIPVHLLTREANALAELLDGDGVVLAQKDRAFDSGFKLADVAGIEVGQEIVAVDGVPTPSGQAVMEQLFLRLGETGTLELRVVQPESDLQFDMVIPLDGWLSDAQDPDPASGLGFDFYQRPVVLGDIQPGGAAERAGLRKGDVLVSVDGAPTERVDTLIAAIRAAADKTLVLQVLRDGQPVQISVIPELKTLEDGTQAGQIGVALGYGPWPEELIRQQSFGPLRGLSQAWERTVDTSWFVLVSMKKLLVGEISTKNLSGPIGIAKVAGDHARAGFIYFVEFLAILSVYLGVLNLLPIPILDGGHLMFLAIEAIRGRPLSLEARIRLSHVGLIIVVGLMLWANGNDVVRLVERYLSR